MISFLKSSPPRLPRVIYKQPAAGQKNVGYLVPSFSEGSVFLKDVRGKFWRVAWEKLDTEKKQAGQRATPVRRGGGQPTGRRRALPAGVYTLVSYRIVRHDKRGIRWFISATAPRGVKRIAIVAGLQKIMKIDDRVRVSCQARVTRNGVRIMMVVAGEADSGLSIFRGERRITIGYRVSDARGGAVAKGGMEYG